MSLKAIHICFIILATILAFGFGWWALRDYLASKSLINFSMGIGSLIGGGALVIYLFYFINKMKGIGPS